MSGLAYHSSAVNLPAGVEIDCKDIDVLLDYNVFICFKDSLTYIFVY